ncbi:hypothetical protein [Caballeronia sp. M23-90]
MNDALELDERRRHCTGRSGFATVAPPLMATAAATAATPFLRRAVNLRVFVETHVNCHGTLTCSEGIHSFYSAQIRLLHDYVFADGFREDMASSCRVAQGSLKGRSRVATCVCRRECLVTY